MPFGASAEDLIQVYRDAQRYDAVYAAARHALEAGRERLPQGRALILPTLNLSANATASRIDSESRNPAIVPAAYNAGLAATDKWLRERGQEPLDEWIEHIPYRETRRYTRRVLQSYGIYAWLDTGKLPPLAGKLRPVP
jgi:soluble lytic murein transglycosylase-like protein